MVINVNVNVILDYSSSKSVKPASSQGITVYFFQTAETTNLPCYISSVLLKIYLSLSPVQKYSFVILSEIYSPSTITLHVSAIFIHH